MRLSRPIAAAVAVTDAVLRPTVLFEPVFVAAIAYAPFVVSYLPGGVLCHYNRLGDCS